MGGDMGVFTIQYLFSWSGGHADFELEFDEDSIALISEPPDEIPDWTSLDYCKCPNCTLDSNEVDYCPTAVSFIPVIERFRNVGSADQVEVQATVSNRRIFMTAPARRAISSVVGLLFASSGCPHTIHFRPMVRYHIPLSSENETIMRAMSMYTLAQYFKHKTGQAPDMDLEGLRKIYDELQTVNMTMAERLRSVEGTASSSVNSVILLDMYTKMIPEEIDNSLKDLAYLFKSFLD
jgi:hypothetical protein